LLTEQGFLFYMKGYRVNRDSLSKINHLASTNNDKDFQLSVL